jgi:hypothetical protein
MSRKELFQWVLAQFSLWPSDELVGSKPEEEWRALARELPDLLGPQALAALVAVGGVLLE